MHSGRFLVLNVIDTAVFRVAICIVTSSVHCVSHEEAVSKSVECTQTHLKLLLEASADLQRSGLLVFAYHQWTVRPECTCLRNCTGADVTECEANLLTYLPGLFLQGCFQLMHELHHSRPLCRAVKRRSMHTNLKHHVQFTGDRAQRVLPR